MAKKQTAGRDRIGALAPKFAELNDGVLFGVVWPREDKLSPIEWCEAVTDDAYRKLP